MPTTTQRPRRWVEAAALLIAMPLRALADNSQIPYTQNSYAASAECVVEGNNWILYIGNLTAPYAWDAAQNPDGSDFRQRTPLMHLHTNAPNQAITCEVFGTSIDVLGGLQVPTDFNSSAPNVLTVTLDGQVLNNTKDLTLSSKPEGWQSPIVSIPADGAAPLANAMHTLKIQTGSAWRGNLKMWAVSAETTIPTDGWTPVSNPGSNETQGNDLPFVYDSKVSSMYRWDGEPQVYDFGLKKVTTPEQALVIKDDAEATVTLPENSSYVECNGYVGPNYGKVYVDISPAPPGISNLPIERDTNKPWLGYNTFFDAPLDPTQLYTITYSAKKDAVGAGVYLSSTNVLEHTNLANNEWTGGKPNPAPGTNPKSSNTGAIIGGAVGGGVGGLLLLGLLAWCCIRRRRASKTSKTTLNDSEEGSSEGTAADGFESTPMLEKDADAALRPASHTGRPKSGMPDHHRKSVQSLAQSVIAERERERRKSAQSGKHSGARRESRRESALPPHLFTNDLYRPEAESGANSNRASRMTMPRPQSGRGLLDTLVVPEGNSRSRPVSSSSGRGLLDGLAVPQDRRSRPISASSGRGLLDGLVVPPPGSRPTSSSSSRGLAQQAPSAQTGMTASAVAAGVGASNSPPTNLSPIDQSMAALTGDQPAAQSATSLPPGAGAAPMASTPPAAPAAAGPPVTTPPATPADPTISQAAYQSPVSVRGRDSIASEASFFSLPPDDGTGSSATSRAQSPAFLQPNSQPSYVTRPPSALSRQAIPKDGQEVDESASRSVTPTPDDPRVHPGTAI